MEKIETLVNAANKALGQYKVKLGGVERYIFERADFDCSVFEQAGDGFVIVDQEGNNGILDACIKIINEKGFLTHEDYLTTTI